MIFCSVVDSYWVSGMTIMVKSVVRSAGVGVGVGAMLGVGVGEIVGVGVGEIVGVGVR